MDKEKWLLCPACKNKMRIKLRQDTMLENFPLVCPKCKQESLVNVKQLNMKKSKIISRIILSLAMIFVVLAGIVITIPTMRNTLSCIWNTPEKLTALAEDPQIHYEEGALEYAKFVAEILPGCVAQIEASQGRPFANNITIGVYSNDKTYSAANGAGNARSAGITTILGHVLLSPDLFTSQRERISSILTHELSHAHLRSWVSASQYIEIPNWFKEGLAVTVSGGGGVEKTTENEALKAILSGNHIIMETKGSLFHVSRIDFKNTTDESVSFQTQYMQASLFIEYLKEKDVNSFNTMLAELLEGRSFENAVFDSFNATLDELWSDFVLNIQETSVLN